MSDAIVMFSVLDHLKLVTVWISVNTVSFVLHHKHLFLCNGVSSCQNAMLSWLLMNFCKYFPASKFCCFNLYIAFFYSYWTCMSVTGDSMSKTTAHSYVYITQKHQKACMSLWQKLSIKEKCSNNLMQGYFGRFVWRLLLTQCKQTRKCIFKRKFKMISVYCTCSETYFCWHLQPECRYKILFICNSSKYKEQF